MLEDRLREIEVLVRRVAPPTVGVRWAEVGGGDLNRPRQTPLMVIHALDFKARATAQTIVEQSST